MNQNKRLSLNTSEQLWSGPLGIEVKFLGTDFYNARNFAESGLERSLYKTGLEKTVRLCKTACGQY